MYKVRVIKTLVTVLAIFFVTGVASTVCSAFSTQGGIIRGGVVADVPDQRRILPGVVVTLRGERLGDKKIQSITDNEGQFDFPSLVAGEYEVTVEFLGFKKYGKRLSVRIDATVEHDILLQPVPLTETVTVNDNRRAGFTIFNITNHWNPRDVQNNLASRQFGTFFNSPDRSVRLKFEFVKY